ncbi:uncharacterized protein LOC111075738 [Drosophila obscura]|uniref:uncharacterized protein LOC111075738 n=1 Tax=Drosophila obscura TaxID=7282 RepID=UPI000BA005AA|nr:uncharacterized protein LOC111075738 [Drosophila obscura]
MRLAGRTLLLLSFLWAESEGRRIWYEEGPLYESTKLLIAEQRFRADQLWNDTNQAIYAQAEQVQQAKDTLDTHQRQVSARLEEFFDHQYTVEWGACFKQHEREVAHFNRELIDKYSICRQSLDNVMAHFEQEVVEEASFLNVAAQKIADLAKICQVWQLKQSNFNHAGVLLCTVAGIGGINQRLASSLELCWDILLEMSLEELDTPSCSAYHQLKMQFDAVYAGIETCVME